MTLRNCIWIQTYCSERFVAPSLQERTNMEASKRVVYIKKIHEKTKEAIELKAVCKAASMNKHRKKVLFEWGTWFGFTYIRSVFLISTNPN